MEAARGQLGQCAVQYVEQSPAKWGTDHRKCGCKCNISLLTYELIVLAIIMHRFKVRDFFIYLFQ